MHEDRDFLMRAVKQFAEAIARLFKVALVDPQTARAQLEAATRTALGVEPSALVFVDAKSAALALGRTDRVLTFALYLEALGELAHLTNDGAGARRHWLHALDVATTLEASADQAALSQRLRERLGATS